jgi:hypothetical protein
MPTLRCFLASSAVLLVAACGSKGPKPVNPNDVKGPGDLGGVDVTPPGIPGVSYIDMSCKPPVVNCNGQPFDMHVTGDKSRLCRITQGGGVAIEIGNKTDPSQLIAISFDGYHGVGTYTLTDAQTSKVAISQSLSLKSWGPEDASCSNGSWDYEPLVAASHSVGSPEPSCGATQCEVVIGADTGAGASPRTLKGRVTCAQMCVNNDDVVCEAGAGGPIVFSFIADDCTN